MAISTDILELQPVAELEEPKTARETNLLLVMGVVFFFSGFSSLIYEVVWMRSLSLFFGSDVYSAALTLSSFMGGLTLGSLLAAKYSDHLKKPLVWYGLLEISIGLYALFFPHFLNMFSGEYRRIYQSFFDTAPWLYNGFRILVASVTLLIPTTMMGSTLPLVVKRFAQHRRIGRYSGFFYSINTFGALAGVLGVGFALLPNLGIKTTTLLACCINVAIGSLALGFGLFSIVKNEVAEGPDGTSLAPETIEPGHDPTLAKAGLIGIGLSGLAALALEVVWMRILTQSFSGAVYSFSIMLSCFLFGIYFGSKKIADIIDRRTDPMRLFGFLELFIGVTVALLGVLTYFVPRFFSNLLWLLTAISKGHFGVACTAAEFAVSGFLIAIPTILMGATFPVAVKICTPTMNLIGRGTARVYAANTAGAIVGSLLGGLILLPVFGSRVSLLIIACIFTITGLYLLYHAANRRWIILRDPEVVTSVGLFAAFAVIALLLPRQIVTNFYYAGNEKANVIYHAEGIAHTIDIIKTDKNVTIRQVNGTLEADTTYSQRRHFILKAHLPLLLHPNPHQVAVVGLGLGITLSATNRHPGLDRIQLIELSPEMVKAQSHLEEVSGGVLRSPKIKLRIDDGRNFMAMSNQQFDMITADPIHPRVSGVGYLYTSEYYEALKQRLRPDGVVCQWMPMYRISKKSFDVAFRTFVRVFPNASFWYVRGHGLFVATQDNFSVDYKDLERRIEDPVIKADLASINIHGPAQFMSYMLMGPDQIRTYLEATPGPVNTDDNAYLEYHTPFEFLESTKTIVAGLIPYSALDLNVIRNASGEERNQLTQEWNRRRAELLPEFDSKLDE
jgi:spermidine synthase